MSDDSILEKVSSDYYSQSTRMEDPPVMTCTNTRDTEFDKYFAIDSISQNRCNVEGIEIIIYNYLTTQFRKNWDYGLPGIDNARKYLNLLVKHRKYANDILSISNIIQIILSENCDLVGISFSKLLDNLEDEYRRLYRKRL